MYDSFHKKIKSIQVENDRHFWLVSGGVVCNAVHVPGECRAFSVSTGNLTIR